MEEKFVTVRINGHYEVYNQDGEFIASGDTEREREEEIAEIVGKLC